MNVETTTAAPRRAAAPSRTRIWLSAIRPATLTAGIVPVIVGSALAVADGTWHPARALLFGIWFVSLQIVSNLVNDYADFERGADDADRLGPKRAAAQGWLTVRDLRRGVCVVLGVVALASARLIWLGGWPAAGACVVSVLGAVGYTAGPAPLAYLGLGDVMVVAFFGETAVCGAYAAQTLRVSGSAVLAGAAMGLMSTGILVVNNLRDHASDRRAGKRTLVARFGDEFGRIEYGTVVLLPYVVITAAWGTGLGGAGWLVPLASLPLALAQVVAATRAEGAALNPHLGRTARLGLIFGVLLAVGFVKFAR